MNYFTINNEKIFIEIKDKDIILKKYIAGILTQLEEEEKEKILKKLQIKNKFILYTQMLIEIIKSNKSLQNKDYDYTDILSYIEGQIPEKNRANFYNKLKTLQIELDFDINREHLEDEDELLKAGYYNIETNKIVISSEFIKRLREISLSMPDNNSFFTENLEKCLLHELYHMASSTFNEETGIYSSGFVKNCDDENIYDSNRGLTEGFTELLACCRTPFSNEITMEYQVEMMLINQLIQIIGIKPVYDSYFYNLGTDLLSEKLFEISPDMPEEAKKLFINIELNYLLELLNSNQEQTLLGESQRILVAFYSQKIYTDIASGVEEDEIKKSMSTYKNVLITNEVITKLGKDPSKYPNLNISTKMYQYLEENVNNAFKGSSK